MVTKRKERRDGFWVPKSVFDTKPNQTQPHQTTTKCSNNKRELAHLKKNDVATLQQQETKDAGWIGETNKDGVHFHRHNMLSNRCVPK
jgi:hypothetical protein